MTRTRKAEPREPVKIIQLFDDMDWTCIKCKRPLPVSAFQRDKYKKYGIKHVCKECYNSYQKPIGRNWRSKNRDKLREEYIWRDRKFDFGITKEQYLQMLADQNGACAICKVKPAENASRKMHVDHNHTTGEIRGLLCRGCNHGLGHFGDSITIIKNAACYLEERGSYGKT